MEPAAVVTAFYDRMQARQWLAAGQLLAPDVHIGYTSTGEQFDGAAFIAMNEAYPEGWEIRVHEVLAAGSRVACQVAVHQDGQISWCAGFYTVVDGLIADGVEHWVTEGAEPAPAWRRAFTTP